MSRTITIPLLKCRTTPIYVPQKAFHAILRNPSAGRRIAACIYAVAQRSFEDDGRRSSTYSTGWLGRKYPELRSTLTLNAVEFFEDGVCKVITPRKKERGMTWREFGSIRDATQRTPYTGATPKDRQDVNRTAPNSETPWTPMHASQDVVATDGEGGSRRVSLAKEPQFAALPAPPVGAAVAPVPHSTRRKPSRAQPLAGMRNPTAAEKRRENVKRTTSDARRSRADNAVYPATHREIQIAGLPNPTPTKDILGNLPKNTRLEDARQLIEKHIALAKQRALKYRQMELWENILAQNESSDKIDADNRFALSICDPPD